MPRILTCLHFYVGKAWGSLSEPDVLDRPELPERIVQLNPRPLLAEAAHEDLAVLVPFIMTSLVSWRRLNIDQSEHELE